MTLEILSTLFFSKKIKIKVEIPYFFQNKKEKKAFFSKRKSSTKNISLFFFFTSSDPYYYPHYSYHDNNHLRNQVHSDFSPQNWDPREVAIIHHVSKVDNIPDNPFWASWREDRARMAIHRKKRKGVAVMGAVVDVLETCYVDACACTMRMDFLL